MFIWRYSHNPYSSDGEDRQADRKDHPQGHDDHLESSATERQDAAAMKPKSHTVQEVHVVDKKWHITSNSNLLCLLLLLSSYLHNFQIFSF